MGVVLSATPFSYVPCEELIRLKTCGFLRFYIPFTISVRFARRTLVRLTLTDEDFRPNLRARGFLPLSLPCVLV